MLATVMTSLDTTIANVALPHMAGSVSASQDQMTWVLTSYIIAAAIMTPLTGWLSLRIGRKLMFLVSIAGFTAASMLCGVAQSLDQIVAYRLIQGISGAALIPLSQAVVLDIFPPGQVGQVMAIWGAATMLGPILGPLAGGWLTDNLSWRWVFFINLPVGLLAFAGVLAFMARDRGGEARRFDVLGFSALAIFIGALQLALDRGETKDWLGSREIWAETLIALGGLYVFLVHTATTDHPFFDKALARDRNFVTCSIFGFLIGILLFSTMALMPPVMQGLMGYSVFGAGLVMMPRGLGTLAAMFIVGRLIGRVDTRLMLAGALAISAMSIFMMTGFDLSMDASPFVITGLIQGFGMGFLFVPMSVTAFATLRPGVRAEGAAAFTLIRNIGSSVGISMMQAFDTREAAIAHADMAARLQPGDPVAAAGFPAAMSPATSAGLAAINGEITRQASFLALIDVFRLMLFLILAVTPLLLVMRAPKPALGPAEAPAE